MTKNHVSVSRYSEWLADFVGYGLMRIGGDGADHAQTITTPSPAPDMHHGSNE